MKNPCIMQGTYRLQNDIISRNVIPGKKRLILKLILKRSGHMTAGQSSVYTHDKPRPVLIQSLYDMMFRLGWDSDFLMMLKHAFGYTTFRLAKITCIAIRDSFKEPW